MSLPLASRSPYKVEMSVFWPLPGCLSVASDLCNLFMWKLIINKNMREEKIGLYITLCLIFSVIKTGWLYRASENLLKNISHVICFSFLIYVKEQQRVGFFLFLFAVRIWNTPGKPHCTDVRVSCLLSEKTLSHTLIRTYMQIYI